jgi:parvulin-like peptidyl-prolyl isomerase
MKRRTILALAAATVLTTGVAACQGLKEAFTAHVDVAAKAGSQELSVERLATLLGGVQVPLTPDIAKAIANIWVDYQLLGAAAAKNDTLNQQKLLDDALWAFLAQQRVGKFHDAMVKGYNLGDSAQVAAGYPKSEYLAAQHILISTANPQDFGKASPAVKDSLKRVATKVRGQVTAANFAQMAQEKSADQGSAARGGSLGLFKAKDMVPQFSSALQALQPGQISGVVESAFGYHIIRRLTYAEVKDEYQQAVNGPAIQKADSIYMAGLEAAASIKISPNAPTTIKNVVSDLDGHKKDNTVLATWKGGDFTVSRLVKWLESAPQKEQLAERVRQQPDTALVDFLKQVMKNELVLKAADSAKVVIDSAEMATIRQRYSQAVVNLWQDLGITPTLLADSGKTVAAREKVAAAMMDTYTEGLMTQKTKFIPVAPPVEMVARAKYGFSLSTPGLQRAVEVANKKKKSADSVKAASRPPTEVPIGGAPAAPPAPKPKP